MKTTALVAALLLGVMSPALVAQDPGAVKASSEPSAEAQERAEAIEKEIQTFRSDWFKKRNERLKKAREERKKAAEEGKPMRAMGGFAMAPDMEPFAKRFVELAGDATGADQAFFLNKAIRHGGLRKNSSGITAIKMMAEKHPTSTHWNQLASRLQGLERAMSAEEREGMMSLLADHPSGEVRAWVAITRYKKTIEEAERESEAYAMARKALMAAHAEANPGRAQRAIKSAIDLREKFGIGAEAPDIVGVDLDGKNFKLSDYRGKVIFLDFWGDW